MPPLPSVPNVMKLVVSGMTPVYPWVNVFHFGYAGAPPTNADCGNIADQAVSKWTTEIEPLVPVAATMTKVVVTDLSSPLGGEGEATPSEIGARAGVALPGQVAMLIDKTISRRYRGGHPRTYLYAGVEADLADVGHWAGGFVTDVDAQYILFSGGMTGFVTGGTTVGPEVAVSYIDKVVNPVPPYRRPVPAVFTITGSAAQPELATQRRRVGRG